MPTKTKSAQSPGSAILRQRFHRSKGYKHADARNIHVLDDSENSNALVSVVERNDLEEMMYAAELADRDFTAERGLPQVIINSDNLALAESQSNLEWVNLQKAEEELHREHLKVPRRPPWTTQMTTEELDEQERKSFLEWRRGLVRLEENEKLVLTPFEKNLDFWRQLWRVLERSDVIVMVVDSRNPLFYRCPDLETYVKELDPCKRTIFLLNKADLLPESARKKWADYFVSQGIGFLFWSATEASEAATGGEVQEKIETTETDSDSNINILNREELLDKLYSEAKLVCDERNSGKSGGSFTERPVTVGFVGYPNVGKSSTVNALVGGKKTGVTSTPGKTKHFQTLFLREDFVLCDCPGLVFPSFSSSKAEMVISGVLPIDRMTDQRGPVELVARRVPRFVLEKTYGITIAKPAAHEPQNRPPTAAELLKAYARSRGYFAANGLPDETRASRQILKDYLNGRLSDYHLPPGETNDEEDEDDRGESDGEEEEEEEEQANGTSSSVVEEFDGLSLASGSSSQVKERRQPQRAAHKLHKRAPRKKDRNWRAGKAKDDDDNDGVMVVRGVQQALSHGAAGRAMVKPEDRAKIGLTPL